MNLLKDLNEALTYIEKNIEDEIDMREVARISRSSEYHFKKTFAYLSGMTLLEYIRRRRLTKAGLELVDHRSKVIDVAMKYGYSSPDSFAKAFHQLHGINPSEVKDGKSLKAFPRMTFQLTIQGGDEMEYRIEQKEPFSIVGIKKRVGIVFEGENSEITAMWKSLTMDKIEALKRLSNTEPEGIIQASVNFSEERMEGKGTLDQYIGVATTQACPDEFIELEVSGGSTWAIFESRGPFPGTLQETWGKIYSEWFPSSNYEAAEGPEILSIKSRDLSSPSVESEIWIPVKKVTG
ncbi:AraC family transcriptional regulator [Salinicoccus cyprini]|uniref:AraC family transcriptional regulator n=1 Tax=Salinicoccus cyprini TaxID=2493691 RepID=A0A558AQV7_9STAP|nr:AraC family transcriptional regulator [Salinicoccus cyprini]TVT26653.1 AraC family transcriptional regulator [Salinicoccus cyprini]